MGCIIFICYYFICIFLTICLGGQPLLRDGHIMGSRVGFGDAQVGTMSGALFLLKHPWSLLFGFK